MVREVLPALAAVTVIGLSGCRARDETDSPSPAQFGYQKSPALALIDDGRVAYGTYCAGCHGVEGDGNGEAAGFLSPRPRNFVQASFKFSSTRSGRLPTDDDLRRSIRDGLKGSAMPPWDLLPDRTVTALIAYIKTLSPKWEQRGPAPVVPFVEDSYRSAKDEAEAIARGEIVYHGFAMCWSCHPSYVSTARINELLVAMENPTRERFRDGLDRSDPKENAEGELIYPPDFKRDFVRAGADVRDLYRSIAAGITGTAMPTWVDSMDFPASLGDGALVQPSDIWAIAYYVRSLIKQRPAKLAQAAFEVRDRPQAVYPFGEPPRREAQSAPAEQGEEFLEDEEFDDEEFEDENS